MSSYINSSDLSQEQIHPSKIYSGHALSYDSGIANHLGLDAAIIFNHIVYWLRINIKNPNCQINGKIWMYETMQEIADFFGHLKIDDVKRAISKLLDSGLLIKDNFNKNKFDRTSWYTVFDQAILSNKPFNQKNSFDSANMHNGKSASAQSNVHPCTLYNIKEDKEIDKEDDKSSSSLPSSCLDDDDPKISPPKKEARPTSDIVVKGTSGKEIFVTESQVFDYFTRQKLPYETDIILAAIAKIRTIDTPINDILKYLAITADSISKSNAKSPKIPPKKVSEPSIPKSDAPGVKWGDI
jgi:hypothetical protein